MQTLQISDYIGSIKDFVVIFGFPLAIVSAFVAVKQFTRAITWNKLNATFTLFNNKQYAEAQIAVATELERLNIDFFSNVKELSKEEVDKICEDTKAMGAVNSFLNYFEDYSTALKVGVLHRRTAFHLMGDSLARFYKMFQPLIKHRRNLAGQRYLWAEFEMASIDFGKMLNEQAKKQSEADIKVLQSATTKEYYKSIGDDRM